MATNPPENNVSNRRNSSTISLTASHSKNNRYKDWFRPRRWLNLKQRTLSSSFLHPLDRYDGSWELTERDYNKRELEELAAATWNQDSCIALLGLSEIRLEEESLESPICNVEKIVLAHEHTAEYLQQEKYRLQILQKSKTQRFSLKRIPPNQNSSTRVKKLHLKLLIQEASILAKLGDHPNIPALRGLPTKSCPCSDFFLLTDRLHEDTLETRIWQWRQGGKSVVSKWDSYLEMIAAENEDDDTTATPNDDLIPRKTNYALQIAQALQACHEAGIVVRDLCPETIGFLADDPHRVQLLDLGYAMDTNSLQVAAKMVGKRRYQAGEIWKTGRYSFKTDVYSWAMIFYEMVMERKPFHSYSEEDHQTFVWEKGDRPLVASYSLPDGMKPLMEGAWDHDPQKRLSIDQVVHKTQSILMNLDSCLFWIPEDDDFLFDVYLETDSSDAISEMGDEVEQEPTVVAKVVSVMEQSNARLVATDESSADGTQKSGLSRGSSMIVQQCKLVSSAA